MQMSKTIFKPNQNNVKTVLQKCSFFFFNYKVLVIIFKYLKKKYYFKYNIITYSNAPTIEIANLMDATVFYALILRSKKMFCYHSELTKQIKKYFGRKIYFCRKV